MLRLVLLLSLAALAQCQRLRQCQCTEIEPCTNVDAQTVLGCTDQCQRYAGLTGASYPALRQCYQQMEGTLNSVIQCMKNWLSNSCSRGGNPLTVRKFYPEFFKLSLLKEINGQVQRSGLRFSVARFFLDDEPFSQCRLECMTDKIGTCMKDKRCGLNLPGNDQLVATLKQCGLASGMGTEGFRNLCRCTLRAGARSLADVCERIIIS